MDNDSPHVTDEDEPRGILTGAQLLAAGHRPIRSQYGPWEYDPKVYVLRLERNGYEVDLERMRNSAQILDWIMQVNGKRWAGPLVIAWLVEAVDDILRPQANYCSFGCDAGDRDPLEIIAKRAA